MVQPRRILRNGFENASKDSRKARASVTRITSKWKNILEENSEEKEDELMIILQNSREKESDLKQMNREVIVLPDEEELENDTI